MPEYVVPKWLAQEDQPLPHPYGLIAGGRWQQICSFSQNCSQSGKVWQNWTMCVSHYAGWWSSSGHTAKFLLRSLITESLTGPREHGETFETCPFLHLNCKVLSLESLYTILATIFRILKAEMWLVFSTYTHWVYHGKAHKKLNFKKVYSIPTVLLKNTQESDKGIIFKSFFFFPLSTSCDRRWVWATFIKQTL